MTRINQVGTVIVPVSDQDRALEFYEGTLGFEKRRDGVFGGGQRWLEVAPAQSSTTLALVLQEGATAEVSFWTADAAADLAELHAKGVDADAELVDVGPGVPPMFTFRDPDGNRFRVVEVPQS